MNLANTFRLNQAFLRIDLSSGVGIHRAHHHKYDCDLMYCLLMLHEGAMTCDDDCVFYAQSNNSAKWIGGFCEDEEFSVDFRGLPPYVDSIVVVAATQKCHTQKSQASLQNYDFTVTLVDHITCEPLAQHTTQITEPCICCDIFKVQRDEETWSISLPGRQLFKSLEERLRIRLVLDTEK